MARAYYHAEIAEFLCASSNSILGELSRNNQFDLVDLQRNTWLQEIEILKNALKNITGHILFEYTIPRIGSRADVVVIVNGVVYLLEFKCGDGEYAAHAVDQVLDYALDLKNFHLESHKAKIVPILIATKAKNFVNQYAFYEDNILKPLKYNSAMLESDFSNLTEKFNGNITDPIAWLNSVYQPTPTIIEAAQALYSNHNVEDISRSDAEAINLKETTSEINKIIKNSKDNNLKSVIFVTGVPGAGKTLVGLNLASARQDFEKDERAVFLSGNFPLVEVLTEALTRDKVAQEHAKGNKITKSEAMRQVKSFIQIIHKYRDAYVGNEDLPSERIAIFDEAQRAWTLEQITKFMAQKKGIANFEMSEPEFLISTMDRFPDWAVIVCLVGGGQEINTGEAGLPEWFDSIKRSFPHWNVYASTELYDAEYTRGQNIENMINGLNVTTSDCLHLSTSMRSFRSENQADFVKNLLDVNIEKTKEIYNILIEKYPIVITRSLETAKDWVRNKARGTERYGIIASSNALRLKPCGVYVKNETSPSYWFLNGKEDVRSSYFLEDVVTEFDIQGLELDYSIMAWDANFRFENGSWGYYRFSGSKWQNLNNENNKTYLKNSYRVLLTRARQGMIIFIPEGSETDHTRKNEYYDGVFNYLIDIGLEVV